MSVFALTYRLLRSVTNGKMSSHTQRCVNHGLNVRYVGPVVIPNRQYRVLSGRIDLNYDSPQQNASTKRCIFSGIKQSIYDTVTYRQRKEKAQFAMTVADRLYFTTMEWLDFKHMINRLHLPDTYFSWFILMEIHIWMLLVRFSNQSDEASEYVKHALVKSFWNDAELRLNRLPMGLDTKVKPKVTLKALYGKFLGHIVAYDEGLYEGDAVLAAALWRNVYNCDESLSPEQLDLLVGYIRKNLNHLETLDYTELAANGLVSFVPLDAEEVDKQNIMELQNFVRQLVP